MENTILDILSKAYPTIENSIHIGVEREINKHHLIFGPLNKGKQAIAEKDLKGSRITMKVAKKCTEYEHKRRCSARGIPNPKADTTLERSVYFSIEGLKKWYNEVKTSSVYKSYPPSGFRIFFSGHEQNLTDAAGNIIVKKGRSSVVLRAMYEKEGKMTKIPFDSTSDILTYNLGGLCPPKCYPPGDIIID